VSSDLRGLVTTKLPGAVETVPTLSEGVSPIPLLRIIIENRWPADRLTALAKIVQGAGMTRGGVCDVGRLPGVGLSAIHGPLFVNSEAVHAAVTGLG
jgi:hypothetical protein